MPHASDTCSCPGCRRLTELAPDLSLDNIDFIVEASNGITTFLQDSCHFRKKDKFFQLKMYRLILAHALANMNSEQHEENIVNLSVLGGCE